MVGPHRIEEHEGANSIEGAHKIELKAKTLDTKTSSSATTQPNLPKDIVDTHAGEKPHDHSRAAASYRSQPSTHEEFLREILSLGEAPPKPEYVPEPDRLVSSTPEPPQDVEAKPEPSIDVLEPKPSAANRPPPSRPRSRSSGLLHPIAAGHAGKGLTAFPNDAFWALLINVVAFTVIFVIVFLVMQIPGTTKVNNISITRGFALHLSPLPLWINSGLSILATIFMMRLILSRMKSALGLVVGAPIGLNVVLSQGLEGFVGYGVLFGFGTSMVCLLVLLLVARVRLQVVDSTIISMVTGLSLMPIVGFGMHFMAAVAIGMTVGAMTQVVLFLCVLLYKPTTTATRRPLRQAVSTKSPVSSKSQPPRRPTGPGARAR